jgi:hypothetical protein
VIVFAAVMCFDIRGRDMGWYHYATRIDRAQSQPNLKVVERDGAKRRTLLFHRKNSFS